jgi:hypothetical protein
MNKNLRKERKKLQLNNDFCERVFFFFDLIIILNRTKNDRNQTQNGTLFLLLSFHNKLFIVKTLFSLIKTGKK